MKPTELGGQTETRDALKRCQERLRDAEVRIAQAIAALTEDGDLPEWDDRWGANAKAALRALRGAP